MLIFLIFSHNNISKKMLTQAKVVELAAQPTHKKRKGILETERQPNDKTCENAIEKARIGFSYPGGEHLAERSINRKSIKDRS